MKQYLIYAWDAVDEQALDRRMTTRPAHLDGARALKANGNFLIGGAMLNETGQMAGSMMVVQFENEAGLQQWLDTEPYIQGKVWDNIRVIPFRVADV